MLYRILTEENILLFKQNMIAEEKSNVTIEKYIRDIKQFAESRGVLYLQSFFRSKINVNTAEESGYSLAVFFCGIFVGDVI